MELLKMVDNSILISIYNKFRSNRLDKIMSRITLLGDYGFIWIAISIILLTTKKYRNAGEMCILGLMLTSILGEGIIKHFVQRERPDIKRTSIVLLIKEPLTYSFPSGHTASSFAAAGILSSQINMLLIPVFVLAFLIAFSRLYLMVHYPSDVLIGIVLGLLCSNIIQNFIFLI